MYRRNNPENSSDHSSGSCNDSPVKSPTKYARVTGCSTLSRTPTKYLLSAQRRIRNITKSLSSYGRKRNQGEYDISSDSSDEEDDSRSFEQSFEQQEDTECNFDKPQSPDDIGCSSSSNITYSIQPSKSIWDQSSDLENEDEDIRLSETDIGPEPLDSDFSAHSSDEGSSMDESSESPKLSSEDSSSSEDELPNEEYEENLSGQEEDDVFNQLLYPGSNLSVGASCLLIIQFSRKYKLSRKAQDDLLSLIEVHCPKEGDIKLPRTHEKLVQRVIPLLHKVQKEKVCKMCIDTEGDLDVCPHEVGSFLYNIPLKPQLKRIIYGEYYI